MLIIRISSTSVAGDFPYRVSVQVNEQSIAITVPSMYFICNYCSQYVFHILWTVLMFAIVKILTNVGVSRWIDKEKDEFKRDMEKQSGATY